MKILIAAAEVVPFAKVGGLADVTGALPKALKEMGHDVRVVMPKYQRIQDAKFDLQPCISDLRVPMDGHHEPAQVKQGTIAGDIPVYLIDSERYFHRDGVYGYRDDDERFIFFSRAALEMLPRLGWTPDVLHCNDWHTAIIPNWLKTLYRDDPRFSRIATLFTIHNLAYQGSFESDWLPRLDLGWDQFSVDRLEFYGRISFLKGGINAADVITTVSRRYAQEIQTPTFGFGFDGILRARAGDLVGVLNGIDVAEWDPAHDPFLPKPFSLTDLSAKHDAKVAVLGRYGLATDRAALERPLIGMVSRMVDQKGFDLIAATLEDLARLDAGLVVLGTGEPHYQEMWSTFAARYPDRIGARIGFDESLAHRIEAGADIFLMPSRFEPCGLNQMYSMRYGTVPVVHGVGGLADTVVDYSPGNKEATGFVMVDYTPQALLETLNRALTVFADSVKWLGLQRAGMQQDFSWDRSAREYVKIYQQALRQRAQR
jgi:starch synthase